MNVYHWFAKLQRSVYIHQYNLGAQLSSSSEQMLEGWVLCLRILANKY